MKTCLNCHQPLQGAYCCSCGQKASTTRFTMAHVLHNIQHSILEFDFAIVRHARSIFYPRLAVLEYLAGRRKKYFNPLLFYFITLGLIFFLGPKLNVDTELKVNITNWAVEGYDQGRWINDLSRFLYFTSAFIFAVPYYYMFRKETGFTYPEQVVSCFFMLGYVNIVCLLSLPFIVRAPFNEVNLAAMLVFTFLIYLRKKWWLTLIKSLLAVLMYVFLFTALLLFTAYIGYLVLLITN